MLQIKKIGFTLIELLVVIAIIALLVSLLLAGVVRVRASARKAQCMNHHRQCALAALHYADSHKGRLPNQYALLPYVEENAVIDAIRDRKWTIDVTMEAAPAEPQDSVVDVFQCPAAAGYPRHAVFQSVSPDFDGSFLQGRLKVIDQKSDEVIFDRVGAVDVNRVSVAYLPRVDANGEMQRQSHFDSMWSGGSIRRVTDGMSKTIMWGESTELGNNQAYLATIYRLNVYTLPYAQEKLAARMKRLGVSDIAHNFSSPHRQFHAAFGDGSVHSLEPTLPRRIILALVTRSGGEQTNPM